MAEYKLRHNPKLNKVDAILKKTEGLVIPIDTENTDYTKYLAWVDAGNTAEASD